MRTTIEIDERLLREVMRTGEFRTKRAAIEAALRLLVKSQPLPRTPLAERLRRQGKIRKLRGKIQWMGDIDAGRS